ncbi:MAG TPA: N-6 DNA methylase, partial [Thermoanaerobaculia bacterium]
MLTAPDLHNADAVSLLRRLGYPVSPVDVDAEEWRRGGVNIPWNGETRFQLAVRMRDFDLFVLTGKVNEKEVSQFLQDYARYNKVTKSVLINQYDQKLALYDLLGRALRRLDVDLDRPSPHALGRLNLLTAGEASELPRIFDRALDRESVSRQFFLRFRQATFDVAAALRACCPGEPQEAIDGEALLILSRLLFLSFVQEKGWLNGERRFLVDRLAHEVSRGREWFSGVLLPLFFGCLNTPLHERTFAARKLGRIPYLNGGLFEPAELEKQHDLHLPNELMQRVVEEVFEKFDFRIDETDAAGTQVDPEMLGRVFESLMAEDDRATSGSFYTPRAIVDTLTEKAILRWLGEGEPRELAERLETITILDPACGSGAFLLSALGVVERLYGQFAGEVPRDLRRRIIERSLYGVDLKPEAVRLCELRLWLAIVANSTATIEEVEPLPNLDRNIMQGNSLLAPTDFLGDARADIYHQWLY